VPVVSLFFGNWRRHKFINTNITKRKTGEKKRTEAYARVEPLGGGSLRRADVAGFTKNYV